MVRRTTRCTRTDTLVPTTPLCGSHLGLPALDPETASRLMRGDSQRLGRAYEVGLGTGRGLAAWQADSPAPPLPNPVFRLLLRPPRDALYARIDRRFEAMLAAGALDEARAVLARTDLPADAPMRKAHGLPELLQYLKDRKSTRLNSSH